MIEQQREKNKLNHLMTLHAAMSPLTKYEGQKVNSIKGYSKKYNFETRINNPFIEKSDIHRHKADHH